MNYELGLTTLKRLAQGTTWYMDILLYEARLRENLQQEQLYGFGGPQNVTRNQIIDGLNHLAYDHYTISFVDLCLGLMPEPLQTATSSPSDATPKSRTTQTPSRDTTIPSFKYTHRNVFIGYSQKDKRFLVELRTHLAVYIRDGIMDPWDASRIVPGSKQYDEIIQAIQAARVAILLISADFLASDFIATSEVPPLLLAAEQEGMTILCVVVGSCAIEDTRLAQFYPINSSSNPLNTMTPGKRDGIWKQVATQVRDILQS